MRIRTRVTSGILFPLIVSLVLFHPSPASPYEREIANLGYRLVEKERSTILEATGTDLRLLVGGDLRRVEDEVLVVADLEIFSRDSGLKLVIQHNDIFRVTNEITLH